MKQNGSVTITPGPHRHALQRAGLDRYEPLMRHDLGDLVTAEPGAEVRRFTLDDRHYFLKRSTAEPTRRKLRALFRARIPRAAPLRELAMLRRLQTAGIHAMRPVAWGQRTRFAIPTEGFLLVEEVAGRPALDLFDGADPATRRRLARSLGALLARLHIAGFFDAVRLRDLICAERPDYPTRAINLVLIDRETTVPRQRRFTRQRAAEALARCYAKLRQTDRDLPPHLLLPLLRAYARAVRPRWPASIRQLIAACLPHLARLTRTHAKYRGLDLHLPQWNRRLSN